MWAEPWGMRVNVNEEARRMGARAGTGVPTPQTLQGMEKPESESHSRGQSAHSFHSATPTHSPPHPTSWTWPCGRGRGPARLVTACLFCKPPELGLMGRVTQGPPVTHLSEWTASSQGVGCVSHDWFPLPQGRGWWEPKCLLNGNQGIDKKVPHAMRASSYYSSVWKSGYGSRSSSLPGRQHFLFFFWSFPKGKTVSILIIFTSIKIDQTSDLHQIGLLCVPC